MLILNAVVLEDAPSMPGLEHVYNNINSVPGIHMYVDAYHIIRYNNIGGHCFLANKNKKS